MPDYRNLGFHLRGFAKGIVICSVGAGIAAGAYGLLTALIRPLAARQAHQPTCLTWSLNDLQAADQLIRLATPDKAWRR